MAAPQLLVALTLEGRLCVVVGGSTEALTRAKTLVFHGATVRLVAESPSEELTSWANSEARVELVVETPTASHLDGAWLAVLAERDDFLAEQLGQAAQAQRVFFCAIDQPTHNGFAHLALARAGTLQIGIGTGGAVPGLASALRDRLQRLLDESAFGVVVERLARERREADATGRRQLAARLMKNLVLSGRLCLDED